MDPDAMLRSCRTSSSTEAASNRGDQFRTVNGPFDHAPACCSRLWNRKHRGQRGGGHRRPEGHNWFVIASQKQSPSSIVSVLIVSPFSSKYAFLCRRAVISTPNRCHPVCHPIRRRHAVRFM